jgi:hypothetical protein
MMLKIARTMSFVIVDHVFSRFGPCPVVSIFNDLRMLLPDPARGRRSSTRGVVVFGVQGVEVVILVLCSM